MIQPMYYLKKVLIVMGVALWALPSQAELFMEGKMGKSVFRQCNQQSSRCLMVETDEAIQSQIKQIFSMKDLTLTISDKTKPSKTIVKGSGYFDFESNQLVVTHRLKGLLVEDIYNLADLRITTYSEKMGKSL